MTPTPIVPDGTFSPNSPVRQFLKIFEFGVDHNVLLTKNSEIVEALHKIDKLVEDDALFLREAEGRRVFEICFDIVSKVAQSMNQGNSLGSVTKAIISIAINVAEDEKNRIMILNQFGIMEILKMLFTSSLPEPDVKLLLSAAEAYSRSLNISWKAPHLVQLVEKCIDYLLEMEKQSKDFLGVKVLVLQFFLNLCRVNKIGVLIIRSAKNCKEMSRFTKIQYADPETGNDKISRLQLISLSSHYFYCTQMVFSLSMFKPAFELAQSLILDTLQLDHETELKQISSLLFEISELIETLTDHLKILYEDFADKSHLKLDSERELNLNEISIKEIKEAFVNFSIDVQTKVLNFVKIVSKDQMKKNNLLQFILKLIFPLNPNFINSNTTSGIFKIGLQIIQNMTKCMEYGSIDDSTMLRFINMILDQLLLQHQKENSNHKNFETYFHDFVRAQKLDQTLNGQEPIDCFIGSARLMSSCLTLYPNLNEIIKLKLKSELINGIFQQIVPDDKKDSESEMDKSICAVEILHLLSNSSDCTQTLSVFMKFATLDQTYAHLSNCIIYGDEKMVGRAFIVTRAAGFSIDNILGFSKHFHAKRAKVCMGSFNNVQLPTVGLSINAFSGAKKLNEAFNSMDFNSQSQKEKDGSGDKPPLIVDVLSLMKLNQDMSAYELTTMQNQNCELNKTIFHLKGMLEKQTNLMINKIGSVELKEKEILVMNSRLEKKSTALDEITKDLNKANKEVQGLKLQISAYKESADKIQTEMDELSKERGSLEEKLKKYKLDGKTLRKELSEVRKQSEKLEGDLKIKDKELKNVQILLEKEKQTVNTIRGLLGNQF